MTNKSYKVKSMYDSHTDVLAFQIKNDYEYSESIELDNGILLDFDNNYIPVSLEILDASKKLNVPKYSLHKVNLNMEINIDKNIISVKAIFEVNIHEKKQSTNFNLSNNNFNHIPDINISLIA